MAPGPLTHLVFHSSVAIKLHCKWLYVVMLENHNNFVNIKIIELVICLRLESGFPSPLTVHLFRPNLPPSAARTLNSALSSCLHNHTLTLALTPGCLQGFPKHLGSNSSFSQPVGEAPIRHHYYLHLDSTLFQTSHPTLPGASFPLGHWKTSVVLKDQAANLPLGSPRQSPMVTPQSPSHSSPVFMSTVTIKI